MNENDEVIIDAEEVLEEQEFKLENEIMDTEAQQNELLKNPMVRANIVYQNYLNTCGRILSGQEKRTIRRKIERDTKKGRYDYLFDADKIAAKERRARAAFEKLNAAPNEDKKD